METENVLIIGFAVVMCMLAGAGAIAEYQKGQCKIAAIHANVSSEEIIRVCGK